MIGSGLNCAGDARIVDGRDAPMSIEP